MRRPGGWVFCVVVVAACTVVRSRISSPAPAYDPLTAGLTALQTGAPGAAGKLFAEAGGRYPVLADYTLYFRARAAVRAGRPQEADGLMGSLLADHPDSIWAP